MNIHTPNTNLPALQAQPTQPAQPAPCPTCGRCPTCGHTSQLHTQTQPYIGHYGGISWGQTTVANGLTGISGGAMDDAQSQTAQNQ